MNTPRFAYRFPCFQKLDEIIKVYLRRLPLGWLAKKRETKVSYLLCRGSGRNGKNSLKNLFYPLILRCVHFKTFLNLIYRNIKSFPFFLKRVGKELIHQGLIWRTEIVRSNEHCFAKSGKRRYTRSHD